MDYDCCDGFIFSPVDENCEIQRSMVLLFETAYLEREKRCLSWLGWGEETVIFKSFSSKPHVIW